MLNQTGLFMMHVICYSKNNIRSHSMSDNRMIPFVYAFPVIQFIITEKS